MPEGDTIMWAANRIRPALEGRTIDTVRTHARFARDRRGQRWRRSPHRAWLVLGAGEEEVVQFDNRTTFWCPGCQR